VGQIFWIHIAEVYVFEGRQPGNAEAVAEGGDQVRSWHGFDFALVPLHAGSLHPELKNFVEAGWSVPEALVAATKTNSEILDMDESLGTLQAGKLADVLVVDGRPDENLDDLAKVDLVIRDGYKVVEGGHLTIPRHQAQKMKVAAP